MQLHVGLACNISGQTNPTRPPVADAIAAAAAAAAAVAAANCSMQHHRLVENLVLGTASQPQQQTLLHFRAINISPQSQRHSNNKKTKVQQHRTTTGCPV